MSVVLRSIDMTLTPASIGNAIKELSDFKSQLEQCLSELVGYLVSYGQEVARIELVEMEAEFTGALIEEGILGFYNKDEHCGVIYSDKPYAMFVEFGTGFAGLTAPHHPMEGEVGWAHDVNNHAGVGWWYPAPWGLWIPKEGKHAGERMAWTMGMRSRPFMYNTLRELERIAESKGIDFFRNI